MPEIDSAMENKKSIQTTDTYEFLIGGGEMGERIRKFDWSQTVLGPVDSWPRSLRTCVQIMLTSRQPIWIGWGKELIKLYNDPYKQIVKGKHPWALGKPASTVWQEIWQDIDPMLKKVMQESEGTYVESQLLIMERTGCPEETYYTFSYTPVAGDDGRTEGMICFNTDDTDRIISARQLKTLTEIGKSLTDPHSEEEVFSRVIDIITRNQHDFPFAILYRTNGKIATMEQCTDLNAIVEKVPRRLDINGQDEISQLCRNALDTHLPQVLHSLIQNFGPMPTGAWTVSPDKAVILPLEQRGGKDAYGFLVIGLNPFRQLDEKYLGFFNLIADQIGKSLSNVHALEEERTRLEALAAIDRAKTIFFSNISHEFRTPLTLLIGPIGDLMEDPNISPTSREKADVALRNVQRMQKLVNMLLDFSRIEAGKMEANPEAVDIGALTEDLCSSFRSAIEKGGMQLVVTREEINEPVFVDVDMWEKIILNLVSNAFKYSDSGTIEVSVRKANDNIEVAVKDTGVGIEASELEKIFERFHRVQSDRGRSTEGTGIGLAMVKELAKLHNGTITVTSEPGKGSTFTVIIPVNGLGPASSDRVKSRQNGHDKTMSSVYVDEALKWLPQHSSGNLHKTAERRKESNPVVLVADDNADMRTYMDRILSSDYNTILAHDGEDAFIKSIEEKPALILSDIMMPRLDGFGLLKKLKNNMSTRHIPVIFLSARAGEEARVEGIQAGADDYLTKPFSSKELLARIANQIAIAKARRHTEREFYNMFSQSPAHVHIFRGPDHIVEFFHPLAVKYVGRDLTGQKLREALPSVESQGYFELLDKVYRDGVTIKLQETRAILKDENSEEKAYYFNITYLPYKDADDRTVGVLQFAYDITEQVMAKYQLVESEERLRIAMELIELGTWEYDPSLDELFCSERVLEQFGFEPDKKFGLQKIFDAIIEDDREKARAAIMKALEPGCGGKYFCEFSILNPVDKKQHILRNVGKVFFDKENRPVRLIGTTFDITEIVKAEREIQEREKRFRILATSIHQIVWITDDNGMLEYLSDQWEAFTGSSPDDGIKNYYQYIHPEDLATVLKKGIDAMKTGTQWETEYRLKNVKTGKYRWFLGKTLPLRDEAGKIINWIGSASDIQELKEQSSWLEQQIQDRTQALKELNESLKQSNEDLQQFAHVASHDLKEPVRKIKTYTNRLREEFLSLLPDNGKNYLEKIGSASDRMNSMIDGVLAYSTYSALDQLFEVIDLNIVLKEIELDLEVLIQDKGATLLYGNLPFVYGAPVLIHQLFYNLVYNSLKFTNANVPPVIAISGEKIVKDDKLFAKILLRDNGIGFEDEHAELIFTTFTRLNSKDKYEGTGLGLSLCKKIVQKHGGEIRASGIPNVGATFELTLPGG
jgi:PAS domain S-box-containing protein